MHQARSTIDVPVSNRHEQLDYILDMVLQLARMARVIGELPTAIQLAAIIAVRRATAPDRPEPAADRRASP